MASNYFGNIFRITTWGESHGPAIGVVIDGVPAGLAITENDINQALLQRAPGNNAYTSPRKEPDHAKIYAGVFEGKTTGAPISIIIDNQDADSSKYEPIKNIMRPGHANYTYLQKYGCFDYRGGGRASARETAARVAAAAVANQLLTQVGINIIAYIKQIGNIVATISSSISLDEIKQATKNNIIYCPDVEASNQMMQAIENCKQQGDSLGGIVELQIQGLPVGLGEPIYEKVEAKLAYAMLSLPASKGFEIGEGFHAATMSGYEHNDQFQQQPNKPLQSNHAGGTLGGITTGETLIARVAFKPTSSIAKPQQSIDSDGRKATLQLPQGSRHDPCVAIRAVPVVSAMASLVIADLWLMNQVSRVREMTKIGNADL